MSNLRRKFDEREEKVAVLQLALDATVRETAITDIRESHRLHSLAAVGAFIVSEHRAITQYQEGVTREIDALCEVPSLYAGRLDRVSAVLTTSTSQYIPDGRNRPDAEIFSNRLMATAKE